MEIKKSLLNIIALAGLFLPLLSCVTDPEPPKEPPKTPIVAKPDKPVVKATPQPKKALATPITPDIVQTNEHLRGHEGEILIGNSSFHAVLAGVPISRDESGDYKGVIAFFTKKGTSWKKSHLWQNLTFMRQWKGKDHFIPIGLNVESNPEEKSAKATVIFAPSGKRQPNIKLNFHVFADYDWFIVENDSPKPSGASANYWDIRWSSDFGEQIILKETEFQSPATLRFFDDEVMSYVGEINTTGKVALLPQSTFRIYDREESPKNLLHFFIGAPANLDVSSQAVVHKKCLNSFKVSGGNFAVFKKVNLKAYVDCFKKSNTLKQSITLVNDFDRPAKYFLVSENSSKLNYFFLAAKSETKVSNQNQASFQLEDAVSTKRTPFTSTESAARVRVLKTEFGKGRILNPKKDDEAGTYLVRLLSHISPNSVEIIPKWGLEKQGTNLWKGSKWPIDFTLPEGYYRIEVFNLSPSKSCNAVIEIKKNLQNETLCRFPEVEDTGAFSGNFENFQILHPLNVNAPSSEPVEISKSALQAVSKENRQVLRVTPATDKIKSAWKEFRSKNPSESEFIALGRFASGLGNSITREWLCPESRISKQVFSATIKKIRPNALQLFGCDKIGFPHYEAIEMVRETIGSIPLILPATQNNPMLPLSGTAMLVAESGKPENQIYIDSGVLSRLSTDSKYSLGQGAMIKVNTPISPEIDLRPGSFSEEISFDVEVKALWPFEATSLIIEQSDGKSFRREIKIGSGEYAITKFKTLVKSDLEWVQIHLMGRIISAYPGLREQSTGEHLLSSSSPFLIRSGKPLNN
ncbi:hypothetical protein N9D31_02770 [Oligoflexaceae bacterium]|nr:hypothetical protein [Oligoflexaceae bacterium]